MEVVPIGAELEFGRDVKNGALLTASIHPGWAQERLRKNLRSPGRFSFLIEIEDRRSRRPSAMVGSAVDIKEHGPGR